MGLCLRNMFPRVARNSTRSNGCVFDVSSTPVMNPSRTALGSGC